MSSMVCHTLFLDELNPRLFCAVPPAAEHQLGEDLVRIESLCENDDRQRHQMWQGPQESRSGASIFLLHAHLILENSRGSCDWRWAEVGKVWTGFDALVPWGWGWDWRDSVAEESLGCLMMPLTSSRAVGDRWLNTLHSTTIVSGSKADLASTAQPRHWGRGPLAALLAPRCSVPHSPRGYRPTQPSLILVRA